jgi:hypothetical protein
MTTAAELLTSAHRMEYCLLIEGLGWLFDEERGLNAGLDGDVFVTNDFNGDLAAQLAQAASTNLLTSNQATAGDALGATTGFTAIDSANVSLGSGNAPFEGDRYISVRPDPTVSGTLGGVLTVAVAAAAATTYVASFYCRRGDVALSVIAHLRDNVNAIDGTSVTTVLTSEWQRIECTVTTGGGSPTLSLHVRESAEATTVRAFNIDALKIQTGSTATPWSKNTTGGGTVTLHKGLLLPGSISNKIDPVTYEYEVGGMDFSIVDADEFCLENIGPHLTPDETTVSTKIEFKDSTVIFADGTNFVEGDKAWVGGRECIKLGAKSGAGPHTYTGSTRGYLGTPRGRYDNGINYDDSAFAWRVGTYVHSINLFWWDRRARLYAHVPGEDATGMMLLYAGRLRDIAADPGGTEFTFKSSGEKINSFARIQKSAASWRVFQKQFVKPGGTDYASTTYGSISGGEVQPPTTITEGVAGSGAARVYMQLETNMVGEAWRQDYHQRILVYQYRTEPGGTAGAKAAFDTTAPQAASFNGDSYCCGSFLMAGDKILHVLKKMPGAGGTRPGSHLMCDAKDEFSEWLERSLEPRSVKFLLDNVHDEWRLSRFAVNRLVRRNPIDLLLIFLTSMNNEFWLGDVTGGTTSAPVVANDALGSATDRWSGYACFGVEGDGKGYMRRILSNSTGAGNALFLERAFPGLNAGEEIQIRNSIYDVLPLGWGLGVHNQKIDIAQLEYIRDRFIPDVTVGKFMLGAGLQLDLLDILLRDLCQSHNILIYIDRNGRLTGKYLGEALGDGIIDDYVVVQKQDIIGELGAVSYGIDRPIGTINLKVRSIDSAVVAVEHIVNSPSRPSGAGSDIVNRTYGLVQSPTLDGAVHTWPVVNGDLTSPYPEGVLDTLEISSMFNSVLDCQFVVAEASARLRRVAVGPPTLGPLRVGMHMIPSIQSGTYLDLTHDAIIDPYTGANGLDNRVALVIEDKIVLDAEDPGLELTVLLLRNVAAAKVAPAATVNSKSSDANGQYLVCGTVSFVADTDLDRDHYYFEVGDLVELRDKTGALKETLTAITGFGTNFASSPHDAIESGSTVRIYVSDVSITSAIVAGDYITFSPWSSSNTARMDTYAAYADTDGVLGTNDDAKEYG